MGENLPDAEIQGDGVDISAKEETRHREKTEEGGQTMSDDLISRQAAIEYLVDNMNWYDEDGYESDEDYKRECITELINGVPSAQPEQSNASEFWRKRADYYSDLCMHLIAEMGKGVKIDSVKISESGIEFIKEQPSAQPERKKGKWIERNPQNSDKCRLIECDQCGFSHIVGFNVPYEHWIENRNFCERCGANMRKGEGEE